MIFGPFGLLPGAQDVFAEVEVARFAGQAVKQHHRLQHAGGRHAHVLPGLDDVALAGLVAKGACTADPPCAGRRAAASRLPV